MAFGAEMERMRRGGRRRLRGLPLVLAGAVLAVAGLLALGGCDDEECVGCVLPPPPAPSGVQTVTGDEGVTVCWDQVQVDPRSPQIVEYLVWRDAQPLDEVFEYAGSVTVDPEDPALSYCFFDGGLANGIDYSYAVSAVDARGGESELSREVVIDTPRPEGYSLELFADSGFDFSALGPAGRDAPPSLADIIVTFEGGVPFASVARAGVLIQDYGTFVDQDGLVRLDWVDWAPAEGYSLTGTVELIEGHAYILEIEEPGSGEIHYAKFAVVDVRTGSVVIDWAYQIVPDLPELQVPVGTSGRGTDEPEPIRF